MHFDDFDPEITKTILEDNDSDEKYGLPDTWARHMQKRTKQDNCQVCKTPFSMVALFGTVTTSVSIVGSQCVETARTTKNIFQRTPRKSSESVICAIPSSTISSSS